MAIVTGCTSPLPPRAATEEERHLLNQLIGNVRGTVYGLGSEGFVVPSGLETLGASVPVGGCVTHVGARWTFDCAGARGTVVQTGSRYQFDVHGAGDWVFDASGAFVFDDAGFDGTLSTRLFDGLDRQNTSVVAQGIRFDRSLCIVAGQIHVEASLHVPPAAAESRHIDAEFRGCDAVVVWP